MKLTPEQKRQVELDRAIGRSSSSVELTSEQLAELKVAQEMEASRRNEHLTSIRRLDCLLEEDSFVGCIRRAINESERSWADHARESGVPADRIEDFFYGEAELSLTETDRLIRTLGLHLVPVTG
jgi:hypothetical protein